MNRLSPIVRIYWWLIFFLSLLNLIFEIIFPTKQTDMGMGNACILLPFYFIAIILAVAVFIYALKSQKVHQSQRIILVAMSMAVVPLFFLMEFTSWHIGWPGQGLSMLFSAIAGLLNLLWSGLLIVVRVRLHAIEKEDISEKPSSAR